MSGPGITPYGGHAGLVWSVACAPDGATLASGGSDGTVRIWDARTGQQQLQLTGHTDAVSSVAYAPGGATLASGAVDGTIRIWDSRTGQQQLQLTSQQQLTGRARAVLSVACAPGGATLASGDEDGMVWIWDARTGRQQRQLTGHIGPVFSMAYAPGGATLASGGHDGMVRIWDARTGRQQLELTGHTGPVSSVAYIPDSATLASGGHDGTIRIWDALTGQHQQLTGHTGPVSSVAYAPDGSTLASGGNDGMVRIWDARTGQQHRQLTGHTGPVSLVAYAPDSATLASGGSDGMVRIWDARTGQQQRQLTSHIGAVYSVAYAPGGSTLASGGNDGMVRIWDARTGRQQLQLTGHTKAVLSVAYAPDGATLASGGVDGTVRIWDARTGRQQLQLTGDIGEVSSVAYAADGADGTALASCGQDGMRIWDASTGRQQLQLTGHIGAVLSVAFAPGGATLASGGVDGTVRIWDARTGQQQQQLAGHTTEVSSVAYAADGATLATSGDTTIRIWNPRNGTQIDGSGFGVTRRIGRRLAGVHSDAPSERDLIAATADVETLADLIAAAETSPPLAIALIGDWGAGKSSAMLQIRRRVDALAEMSRNNPGLSVFSSNVRQIQFNAWDYSDDQLWSGLINNLFRVLAADPVSSPTRPDPSTVEAERRTLRRNLSAQEAAGERLRSELGAADRATQPQGFLAWLGSPVYTWRVVITAVRELAREFRAAPWVLLVWALLGSAAYGVWAFWGMKIGAVATAVVAVIAPALAVAQRLRNWHRRGMSSTVRLRQRLDKQQHIIDEKIADLRKQLALVDASARLSAFISDHAAPNAYQQYRGLLGEVRRDLAILSSDLAAARDEWLASGATTLPPLERIVLYIDDLDRCPPRRVVEVLEAVHLMLALDLFVVVVAVDARWLIQSLEYHYREMFRTDDKLRYTLSGSSEPDAGNSSSAPEADADGGPPSPVDYLDKIFQIPYALTQPPPLAMAAYLRSLLPPVASATPSQVSKMAAAADPPPINFQARVHQNEEVKVTDTEDLLPPDDERIPRLSVDQSEDLYPSLAGKMATNDKQEWPFVTGTGEPELAIPSLRPLGLQLSQPEVDFMTRLAPLLPTPRAAKKLVNLYRLVRIGIPDAELAKFTDSNAGGEYQVVQILLAVLVGIPTTAQRIFHELMRAARGSDIITVFAKAATISSPEMYLCARLSEELSIISAEIPVMIEISAYQRWCPKLARHSFSTQHLWPA